MKGLILAGGRGKRLMPYTDDRPKSLVNVGGRPLFDRQYTALQVAGADEVGVVSGWRSDRFDSLPVTNFESPQWSSTTMVDDLRQAHSWFSRDACCVAYGDIVFDPADARALVDADANVSIGYHPNWLELWSARFASPLDDAEVFLHEDGFLKTAGGRATALSQADGQYVGLLAVKPQGWQSLLHVADDAANSGDPVVDITDLLTRTSLAGEPVRVVPVAGPWWEIDHPSDISLGMPIMHEVDRLLFGDAS